MLCSLYRDFLKVRKDTNGALLFEIFGGDIGMGKINIQMYSFMDGKHDDSRENLRLAAQMGYDGVEMFGPDFQIPAEEMKQLTQELGLQIVSMHVPDKNQIVPMLPYANTVGCHFVGLSSELLRDEADAHRWAKELNEYGKACKEAGCMMIYHNHTQEFLSCGDKRIIDILLDETDPELVGFELDAGWCAAAGFDPVEHVQRYSGRIKLVHVKESSEVIGVQPPIDFDKVEWVDGKPVFTPEIQAMLAHAREINCPACEGLVDWKKRKEAADANGCQAYIVEREYSVGDRVEMLTEDLRRYREVI